MLLEKVISGESINGGCEKCDRGHIRIPKEPFGFDYGTCVCLVEAESLNFSRELLKKSSLPTRMLHGYSVDNWKEDTISFETLLKFMNGGLEKKWLFLSGTAGTGKTYASIICAKIALLQEKSVYFTSVTKLLSNLRPDESSPGMHSVLRKYCVHVDLLILDDIGHEKSSQWVREQLYLIINERWNNMKTTILTSNFPLDNIGKTISSAVYSRVKGESLCLEFDDVDSRIS